MADDIYSDYMQHLNSFDPGEKSYTSPEKTTVQLWPRQAGVLGACKTASSGILGTGVCDTTLCKQQGS
jgi:hypothetical protein